MDHEGCPPPEILLAFARGDLAETELDALDGHFESCPACAEALARLDDDPDTVLLDLRRRLARTPSAATHLGDDSPSVMPAPFGAAPQRLDDYRIVREVGRGGMGVVYEAYQESLNRHVAVKLLREPTDLARFRREARAAGRLHHTNIVPVYGVGEHAGRHYFVMQYIDGRGLDEVLRARREAGRGGAPASPVDYREVAQIVLQAAEAVAYAHGQGIVHRDIKPSNILLDERGTVWITDFGLAYDSANAETLTHTGDVLGTLRYMSPERFSGRGGAGVDIYGLGITLYELACGVPAFPEADRAALIHRVLHHAPPRPRQVDPRVPRDLETIIHKAIAREPDHRYANASELADDLRRFVEDRPIRARRASPAERAWRWSRRNPGLAGAVVATATALMVVAAMAILYAGQKARLADQQTNARREIDGLNVELTKRGHALEDSLAGANLNLAMLHLERGRTACEGGEIGPGLLHLVASWRSAVAAGRLGEPWRRIARVNLSAWQRLHPGLKAVFSHAEGITSVAFSPDGKTAATASLDGTARLWDVASGRPIGPALTHRHEVEFVAFSPDGKAAITGSRDKTAQFWDAATTRPLGSAPAHGMVLAAVASGRDGRTVLAGASYRSAQAWDAATGRPIGPAVTHPGTISHVALSPDGKTILTGGWDATARAWDAATGRPVGPELRHQAAVAGVAFGLDGKTVLTACEDGTARTWDIATGRPVGPALVHEGEVVAAAFSPDGRTALTGSWDGTARTWDTATGRPAGPPLKHQGPITSVAFGPGGKAALTGSADRTARLWDTSTGSPTRAVLRHRAAVRSVAFSPDGKTILTGSDDSTARLWDARTGQPVGPPLSHQGQVVGVAFGPDGKTTATGGWDGTVRLWDAATGQPLRTLVTGQGQLFSVAFGPDGRTILTGSWDKSARLWDAATGRPIGPALAPPGGLFRAVLSPDGRTALTASSDNHARFWDPTTGRSLGPILTHEDAVLGAAFGPDGKVVLTSSADTTARLWDAATGRPIGRPISHRGRVWAAAFSPDGKAVLTGCQDGTARLWDAATGQSLGPPLTHEGRVWAVAFSPDGRAVLTGSDDRTARLWDISSLPDDLERAATWVEVLTGLELDDQGRARPLDASAWRERRDRLDQLGGALQARR